MGELSKLCNISKVTESKLNEAEIYTADQLRELGSKEAFLRIRQKDTTACLHMLYGLQGAVEGIRDTFLAEETKTDLKMFYKML